MGGQRLELDFFGEQNIQRIRVKILFQYRRNLIGRLQGGEYIFSSKIHIWKFVSSIEKLGCLIWDIIFHLLSPFINYRRSSYNLIVAFG